MLVAQNEVAKNQAPDSGAIIALKDSGLNSLADLAGKQIAVSGLHSQMHVAALKALKNAGVDVSTVQSVEVPFASQIDALKSRKVDAVAELDPWTTVLRSSDTAKVLGWTYVDSVPGQPIGAWYVSSAFAKKNPDIVRRFAEWIRDASNIWRPIRSGPGRTSPPIPASTRRWSRTCRSTNGTTRSSRRAGRQPST